MARKIQQYSIKKDYLYFFYRFIILRWELEWSSQKLVMSKSCLNKYCQNQKISIKSFESSEKLKVAIAESYKNEEKAYSGILWFVRMDTKPKDTLRHLRNTFAHGNYKKQQKSGSQCIAIENIDRKKIKAKGFIPLDKLKGLVNAASSCKI
ncbi:hypothetical protein LDO51_06700 [Providencia alcalifaciens]|uniref:hypothetical protein n=1 Tax=Providencia alcalifaciens TaxID=126385 RepID=UPI001CE09E6C|nr:hypothetical protein [Providencia alcalifaciens]UBX50469.1 hypothetical protein LDO51_06700 [Providencia alcalifaciens]